MRYVNGIMRSQVNDKNLKPELAKAAERYHLLYGRKPRWAAVWSCQQKLVDTRMKLTYEIDGVKKNVFVTIVNAACSHGSVIVGDDALREHLVDHRIHGISDENE